MTFQCYGIFVYLALFIKPIINDMMYLLTAIGLSPGGSTHLHTNNTQNNTNNNRTTQITTNVEECGPRPVFASFTLAFALQLRKKHGKSSVRVRKPQSEFSKHITKTHTHYKTNTYTHTYTFYLFFYFLVYIDDMFHYKVILHVLSFLILNHIYITKQYKTPQYKLKQTQCNVTIINPQATNVIYIWSTHS